MAFCWNIFYIFEFSLSKVVWPLLICMSFPKLYRYIGSSCSHLLFLIICIDLYQFLSISFIIHFFILNKFDEVFIITLSKTCLPLYFWRSFHNFRFQITPCDLTRCFYSFWKKNEICFNGIRLILLYLYSLNRLGAGIGLN